MTIKAGEHIVCEECEEAWDCPVEDYAGNGVGAESRSDEACDNCGVEYTVEKNADGTFDVERV